MVVLAAQGGLSVSQTQDGTASELFDAQYPRLAGWCRRLVDDTETAHEIAAEAFTRLWARWSRVEDPRGFLYVTATNLVRDHWRKKERERRAVRRVLATVRTVGEQVPEPDHDLRQLVQTLPDRLRAPVLLHYYADFPIREVALMLDRKEGTVKSDLHEARTQLRAVLEGGQ